MIGLFIVASWIVALGLVAAVAHLIEAVRRGR